MSWPVRHLNVLQHWDCQGCTNCCREYRVYITEEEQQRIAEQGWEQTPEFANLTPVIKDGPASAPRYRLAHDAGHACVFLNPEGRCRIHEKFGSEAKPFACRLYPFQLIHAGDHWRVGLRYSCPSAVRDQGKLLREHDEELRRFAPELEKHEGLFGKPAPQPPPLQGQQSVSWADLLHFTDALTEMLGNRKYRIERRWRHCLALVALCRQATFDRVKGERLVEFLNVVTAGFETDVLADPGSLPAPSWGGRMIFRQFAALYARKDVGPDRGLAARGRLALLWGAWRFARGRGGVPRVHGLLPETTFAQLEQPSGPLSEAAELVLERYYLVKVGSLQFCGRANYGLGFWEGVQSLALTVPVILWLARAFHPLPPEEAVGRAVSIVDHNFGFSPLLGARRQRLGLWFLAHRGELEKLIGWYSR